jgi:septal ring factor EnvC (AmiA/AmiB activator)
MENPFFELQDCRMDGLQKVKGRKGLSFLSFLAAILLFLPFLPAILQFCNPAMVVVRAQSSDRARTEALAKRAGERLVALQREADRLAADERSLLNDLRKLEVDRQIKAEQVKQAGAQVAAVEGDLAAATAKMAALEATEAAERPELSARLVEMYKLGRARYARLLLSTPDLRRIGQASRTVAALAKMDRDRIAEHQRTLDDLKATRATLQTRHREAAALRDAAQKAQAAATRATQAQNDLVRDLDRRRDLNAQLAGELQAVQQKLQAALRDSGSATDTSLALPLKPFRGDLGWPVRGDVRRAFGRATSTSGVLSNGIELTAPDGSQVDAVHDGVVAFAGNFAGFGNLVILDHGSQSFSLYGDLLDVAVTKGAHVDRGQAIGSTGPLPSGGTGLYFELRVDGRPVDPLQWLKRR